MIPADLRIASLLPAATDIAWALGLGPRLVGRSHACDWPTAVARLPVLTAPKIDAAAGSSEIHMAVGRAVTATPGTSMAVFSLDIEALVALRPDVILTQSTCDICAISGDDMAEAVRRSPHPVNVVSLGATTLAGLWDDILNVGSATGVPANARDLVSRLVARCDSLACRVRTLGRARPKVAMIEWLDPPMVAGNWVPELVRMAGGEDVLGRQGDHSHWIDWPTIALADPDVVILAPCGFVVGRIVAETTNSEIRRHLAQLRAIREDRLWAVDGHHLLNRPGPRLIDSLETLAEILHPDQFRFQGTSVHAIRIDLSTARSPAVG